MDRPSLPEWRVDCAVTAKALDRYDHELVNGFPSAETMTAVPGMSTRYLRALPEIMRTLRLDPARVLHDARLAPEVLSATNRSISFPELEKLLLACERMAACDRVGLLLGSTLRLDDQGIAGKVARNCETVGEGLRAFVEVCNLHDTPATASLRVPGEQALFAWTLGEHCLVDTRHFDYMGMAASCNLLQDLCGQDWRPTAVRFASRHPVDVTAFDSLFRAPLEFDAGRSEIEFDARWLGQPLPTLEPAARMAVAVELQQARLDILADLPATLRRVLRKRLLLGDFSMDDVASQLSMHRRTLDRRLQRCSTTYGELLESVRDDISRQLLRDTQFSIQRIAESVRFSSAANFATAFRRRTGMTPTEYRRKAN